MKKIAFFVYSTLLCFGFLLSGCDPMQYIVIENQTRQPALVTMVFHNAGGLYDLAPDSDADTLRIPLDTTATGNSVHYRFGIGTWRTAYALDSLAANIASIRIESNESVEIYREEAVKPFLKDRLRGAFKQLIHIRIE
ncbi:hypothetical protein [Flavilitoribacter nigricans]|uniref:Lipoprotein n=1 Tax=Flavilitoribacter nigricans (strain ATCC 23147 / DSM 23189 / NBRC 102662 / NCIMB 1420 / SS-2) TaxID=1122177 RepID=A0A2D0N5A9_FLAN2|nr:hypothetical protein [Flavilitoribacter nigricans]PHN03691.1 hypothetical protein CRP01_25930 [Flavilitoribacter nigricans DSM 23189 = NBRC 102662]